MSPIYLKFGHFKQQTKQVKRAMNLSIPAMTVVC